MELILYPPDPMNDFDLSGNIAYTKDSSAVYHAVCGYGWWSCCTYLSAALPGNSFSGKITRLLSNSSWFGLKTPNLGGRGE